MELTCFEIVPGHVELRPAPRRRRWMDETPRAFAYHCLPLVVGNLHGWEMLCPFALEATWNGGPAATDLEIRCDPAEARLRPTFVASHFGSGILSFSPLLVVRTEAGWNLWLQGPTNLIKDGIQPLAAAIETDWMPFTFSMNWKLTRPGTVRFDRGEPFASFFPIQRGALVACEPRLRPLDDEPALAEAYRSAVARREHDEKLEGDHYQRWYPQGAREGNVPLKPFTR